MPQVSVIMPAYNSGKFLAEAIESILQQTFTDFEFLIVDDGSTDGSLTIIQEYAERDARIRLIQFPENRGEAVARNTGITHASGDYVASMDSDDVSLPQRLEKQVACLEANANIGAVGVSHQRCTDDLTPMAIDWSPTGHHVIALNFLLYVGTAIKSPTMMVRREYLNGQPVFDTTLAAGSDTVMYLRLLWEKRIRFENVPEVLYLYRRHDNTMNQQHRATLGDLGINVRCQALRRLGEPGRGVEWIVHKRPLTKLSWKERRQARRDITRQIAAMVQHNWVDADDEPLLYAEMEQLVESTAPRYWQMFLHWYRYRIARRLK